MIIFLRYDHTKPKPAVQETTSLLSAAIPKSVSASKPRVVQCNNIEGTNYRHVLACLNISRSIYQSECACSENCLASEITFDEL